MWGSGRGGARAGPPSQSGGEERWRGLARGVPEETGRPVVLARYTRRVGERLGLRTRRDFQLSGMLTRGGELVQDDGRRSRKTTATLTCWKFRLCDAGLFFSAAGSLAQYFILRFGLEFAIGFFCAGSWFLGEAVLRMARRELFIGVGAALRGFFVCFFLV